MPNPQPAMPIWERRQALLWSSPDPLWLSLTLYARSHPVFQSVPAGTFPSCLFSLQIYLCSVLVQVPSAGAWRQTRHGACF